MFGACLRCKLAFMTCKGRCSFRGKVELMRSVRVIMYDSADHNGVSAMLAEQARVAAETLESPFGEPALRRLVGSMEEST